MILLPKLALLILLTGLIVSAVRFLIVPAIDRISLALRFGSKTRGQILGYVTSLPELVIVVSSAAAGVFAAGFWNIASSNIINIVLFLGAVVIFRQSRDLQRTAFIDEISFGLFSVILPLALYALNVQGSVFTAASLLVVFVVYKMLDRRLNRRTVETTTSGPVSVKLFPALLSLVSGVILIVTAGWFLGVVAAELVVELGVSAWAIGWILGFTSSLPELSGFFVIFLKYKRAGTLAGIDDTQEALDTLVASNMCNLGVILPVGVMVVSLLR